MKAFVSIAIPHKDVLEGVLTADVFAADLWSVYQKRGPREYYDAELFYQKTYFTEGLKNLLSNAEKRLKGKGGDPVIQLQTPFGGGKTHSLIALYHKGKELKAKVVVIDGAVLEPEEKPIWEVMEEQLTGNTKTLKGKACPGKEKIYNLLSSQNSPVLILIDEILIYQTKSATLKVGSSNLSALNLVFFQELTQVVSSLGNCLLVVTLPASRLEHYDESSEELFQKLQKVLGRVEKIYEPVSDEEISSVINKRLFLYIDEKESKKIIDKFVNFADKENILPEGFEKSTYRERFFKSYPFQPEVIDVLYHRWGSFSRFQRTRGVLRLLARVVYSLKNSNIPFIRLCDFNLKISDIKSEFISQIGPQFNSVVSADITSANSAASKVDFSLGKAYVSSLIGTKIATTIFLYSFSGGHEKGATLREIKLSVADISLSSTSIITEGVNKLKDQALYLQYDSGKYFFTSEPNLNSLHIRKMEEIEDETVEQIEKEILRENVKGEIFDVFLNPKNPKDVPDNEKLKLVVLSKNGEVKCKEFIENYGQQPRVNKNTLIFLCTEETERAVFEKSVREYYAWKIIDEEDQLNEQQKKEIHQKMKEKEEFMLENFRNLYSIVYVPKFNDLRKIDLGRYTYGKDISLEQEVYQRLNNEGEILEKISPLILKEKYLKDKDFVEILPLYLSFLRTPGEVRIINKDVLIDAIVSGVKNGLFAFGEIDKDGGPVCKYFREEITFREGIVEERKVMICESLLGKKSAIISRGNVWGLVKDESSISPEKETEKETITRKTENTYKKISLKIKIPSGELSHFANSIFYLKTLFRQIDIKVEIEAKDGEIKITDYEDKIKEAFKQSSIKIEEESTF